MARRRTALLIATDRYADSAFSRLRAPANDVARLAAVLADPEIGAFAVQTLLNEPHYVVRREISRVCAEAERDDLILFYVSGHGIKEDSKGSLHFVTTDTVRDHLRTSSVEAELIRHEIDQSRAHQAIVWLDCCYSGAFPTGGTPKSAMDADVLSQMKMEARGWCVMTASTHIQYSYEPHQDAKAVGASEISVFTNAIIEGLRTGAADVDGDGEIGTADLYAYVFQHVRAHTPNQTPTKNDLASGELLVARNKFALRLPAGLDPGIRDLLRNVSPKVRQLAIDHLGNEAREGDRVARETLGILRSNRDPELASAAAAALRPKAVVGDPPESRQERPLPAPVAQPVPVRTIQPRPIVLPRYSKARLSLRQRLQSAGEIVGITAVLGYMIWWLDASAFWTIVLWVLTAVLTGVALLDLARVLLRAWLDVSRVLHRERIWLRPWLDFSPDGENMAGGHFEWKTHNWERRPVSFPRGERLTYSPDNRVVVGLNVSGQVILRDRQTGRLLRSLPSCSSATFGYQGRLIALSSRDGVTVVRVDSGDVVARLASRVHHEELTAFDPTGRFLAVSTRDTHLGRWIDVYDTASWRKVALPQGIREFQGFAFNHDGSLLAATTFDKAVELWDTHSWNRLHTVYNLSQPNCVDFSPDGRFMAIGTWLGRIDLYTTVTWRRYRSMGWHQGWVTKVRFSPDSRVIASCSTDYTIRLWQVEGWAP
nr:caspase family protein [Kibdelosporangium sp. MJ126-NF4]CEL23502.1 High-affnity carbon uptake protein Hat/HatR [Kibdelosporangium sp. MJ126-NF4]CTQ89116.1 High-affnity carbon uptake protein Hat/HatR [Kibdelosporangium sp. MJ126-NF4]